MAEAESRSAAGPAPGLDDWRALVSTALKAQDSKLLGAPTRDGIVIEPLYERRRDTEPLASPAARPWTIVQIIDDPDPERANAQAQRDIAGGAGALALRFADGPSAAGEGIEPTEAALAATLDGVDLVRTAIMIEPHASCRESAGWLAALIRQSGVAPELARADFGLDPLALSLAGTDPDASSLAASFRALRDARFGGRLVCLDSRGLHEAGASEAQELAGVLAAAAWWLRALAGTGIEAPAALPFLGAAVCVDRDVLLSLAKLRALRLLWARLCELCDAPSVPLLVHAETSRRMLTRAEPATNLLRNTIAAFAAGAGGADSLAVLPHTAASGLADPGARALARNIQHLLIDETHLYSVIDPAAGSGAIETLTDALCEHAWTEFRGVEREGGIFESLHGGAFGHRIAAAGEALVASVRSGASPLVGATIHRADDPASPLPAREPPPGSGLTPISLEERATA